MIKFSLLLLISFLLNGCASTIISMMKDQPAFNWTYIPKNGLKKGDSTTFQSFDGGQTWKLEVIDAQKDFYFIKMSWLQAEDEVSFLKDVNYEFTIGKDGFTKTAYLVDASGEKTKLRIAGPGDFGYSQDHKPTKLKTPETIETPVGKFEVSEVVIYSLKDRSTMGGTMNLTCVSFVSDKVPFGYVAQRNTASVKLPLTDVLNFISSVSPMNTTYKSLMKYLLSFSESNTVNNGSHIISYTN